MFSSYDLEEFGKFLRLQRTNCKLSQKDVNTICDVSQETLRRIENGLVVPKFTTLELLSSIYRINLIKSLNNFKTSRNVYDIYSKIDELFLTRIEETKIDKIAMYVEGIKEDSDKSNYVDFRAVDNLVKFLEALRIYISPDSNVDQGIKILTEILEFNRLKFSIDDINNEKFDVFEVRVLILLALFYSIKRDYQLSSNILLTAKDNIEKSFNTSIDTVKLIIKIFINVSYNYHKIAKHNEALNYANLGIEYCYDNSSMYCLSFLYFRKGISLYYLKDSDYTSSLVFSLSLLKKQDKMSEFKMYLDTLKEVYGIDLSDYFN